MSGTTSQTGSGINKQTAEAIRPAPRMSDTAPSTGPIHRHRIRCWLLPFSIVDAAGAARRRAMPRAAGRPTSCRYRTTLAGPDTWCGKRLARCARPRKSARTAVTATAQTWRARAIW